MFILTTHIKDKKKKDVLQLAILRYSGEKLSYILSFFFFWNLYRGLIKAPMFSFQWCPAFLSHIWWPSRKTTVFCCGQWKALLVQVEVCSRTFAQWLLRRRQFVFWANWMVFTLKKNKNAQPDQQNDCWHVRFGKPQICWNLTFLYVANLFL